MLMQPVPMAQGISRPFVVGLVMLLLFLSLQTDWGANKQQSGGRRADLRQLGLTASPEGAELPTAREKIIYELSMTLDKLERENWQLKQHLLDLRRAMRKEGHDLNGTLFTFPDVEKMLQSVNSTAQPQLDKHRQKTLGHTQEKSESDRKQEEGPQPHQRHRNHGDAHHLRGSASEQQGRGLEEGSTRNGSRSFDERAQTLGHCCP